ncbi:ATP-binding protein [Edaphobacter paludis]|uniref:histidine kinase n=1 Tax=Edaphobacter paludis TaxID=3035702 RepID=A0AAU7DA41_9BACT
MRRSLFLSFLVRMMIALVIVVPVCVWLAPRGWIIAAVFLLGWAALSALLMTRSVGRDVSVLRNSTAAIVESPVGAVGNQYADFDEIGRAISLASDELHRRLAEAAEGRHKLEAMIDSMQDAVVAVDQAGRIQWTNQCMQKLIPGSFASGVVRVGHALVQTIRDPDVLQCVRTALEDRSVCERRSTSVVPGRIFEIAASPMPGGGAVAVLHDITRVEQVERIQRDFVANVSHELRTPLTSITGYVETLLDHEASLSTQAREFLTTILKNANRMNRLTEDLLVMARVESSEQELHPVLVQADILIRDAVQAMSGLVQDAEAVLEIGEATTVSVLADTDAIVQVLSNLIENGIKYGQTRSGSKGRVIVSAREVSEPVDSVEFRVRDFGQGIASEHLSRIFERFYRVDKARSRESGGTGLGLAIAHRIVQAHGGTIRAESTLNHGSTFIFTLPK